MPVTTPPHALDNAQVAFLEEEGYLLVPNAIEPADLEPIKAVFAQAVEKQAQQWLAEGKIRDTHPEADFDHRYGLLREQLPPTHSNSWRSILVSPELYAIWQHPVLLGMARRLVGDEVWASRTWNGRPRAPKQGKQTIGWHQDAHYQRDYDPADGPVYSFWLPLVPVDEDSGCLQVAPRSHKQGIRPEVQLPNNGLRGLADHELAGFEPVTCVMQPGDVLIFTELTYHRALDNVSDRVRWSLDIRYHDARLQTLREKNPGGYYCHSSDPAWVTPYETWETQFDRSREF